MVLSSSAALLLFGFVFIVCFSLASLDSSLCACLRELTHGKSPSTTTTAEEAEKNGSLHIKWMQQVCVCVIFCLFYTILTQHTYLSSKIVHLSHLPTNSVSLPALHHSQAPFSSLWYFYFSSTISRLNILISFFFFFLSLSLYLSLYLSLIVSGPPSSLLLRTHTLSLPGEEGGGLPKFRSAVPGFFYDVPAIEKKLINFIPLNWYDQQKKQELLHC